MRNIQYLCLLATIAFVGCAGSPAKTANQSVQQIQEDLRLSSLTNNDLCRRKAKSIRRLLRTAGGQESSYWGLDGMRRTIRAVDQILMSRGYDKRYCEGGSYAYKKTPTQARQSRSSAQTNAPQASAKLAMGEINSSIDINQKVRVGQSRMEAVRSIGSPFETTRFGGVVAASYCQTNAGEDRFITLWFINGGLAEIESVLEHRGVGSCAGFILRPSREDIPPRLRTKSQ